MDLRDNESCSLLASGEQRFSGSYGSTKAVTEEPKKKSGIGRCSDHFYTPSLLSLLNGATLGAVVTHSPPTSEISVVQTVDLMWESW